MKKIKQEDARIEIRKKTLAKNAERMAQARAKAVAAATDTPTSSQEAEPIKVEPPSTAPSVQPVAESPIHPSLPPKPGTSVPARGPGTETPAVAPPAPALPVPPPTTSAPSPTPAPSTDEQILKLEDVRIEVPLPRHLTDAFT